MRLRAYYLGNRPEPRKRLDLKSVLKSVTQKTEVKLAQHVKQLVPTPGKKDREDVYEFSGEWELLPDKKCVILLVARVGFGQNYAFPCVRVKTVLIR